MVSGPEELNCSIPVRCSFSATCLEDMNDPTLMRKSEISFSSQLEPVADNYSEAFKQSVSHISSAVNDMRLWYGRQRVSKQMVHECITPLLVPCTFGSVDVVELILSLSEADVTRYCGPDRCTALHCAASSGSIYAVGIVKLLLLAGANPASPDSYGRRPIDVIIAPPNFPELKGTLKKLLQYDESDRQQDKMKVDLKSKSPPFPSFLENSSLPSASGDNHVSSTEEKKKNPIVPSVSDIKNSMYSVDEFWMFMFKVRPCWRTYFHDWTDCPFSHQGENARRRDPRKFHYSCMPCPYFRKGQCKHGDLCEYAHGVFECWLHPAQYRTRLCKDTKDCSRRVCFFAHTPEELRSPYVALRSAVSSPLAAAYAANFVDMATEAAAFRLAHGCPLPISVIAPPQFTPPDQHLLLNTLPCLPLNIMKLSSTNLPVLSQSLDPFNLDRLVSPKVSSPRYADHVAASAVYSPSQNYVILNQLQQQQNMLSRINTNTCSPNNVECPLFQASCNVSSAGRMPPQAIDQQPLPPFGSGLLPHAYNEMQQERLCSLSSGDLGYNLPQHLGCNTAEVVSNWESSNGKADCSVNGDEIARPKKSFLVGHYGQEPDLSWVQSLLNDSPPEIGEISSKAIATASIEGSGLQANLDTIDHSVMEAWLEQMQLDWRFAQNK